MAVARGFEVVIVSLDGQEFGFIKNMEYYGLRESPIKSYEKLTMPLLKLALEHLLAPDVGIHYRNMHKRCPVCKDGRESA